MDELLSLLQIELSFHIIEMVNMITANKLSRMNIIFNIFLPGNRVQGIKDLLDFQVLFQLLIRLTYCFKHLSFDLPQMD